jgi:hypothetical protein
MVSNLADHVDRSNSQTEQIIRLGRFEPVSEHDWSALMRDILALANTGGGKILVEAALAERDVIDRLARYTDSKFGDVHLLPWIESGGSATLIAVGPALVPAGFTNPADSNSHAGAAEKQEIKAGFYFRHGERSEPGTTTDMRLFVERLLRRARRRWLRGIRRVLAKPITFDETAAPKRSATKRIRLERTVLQPVRIVSDPNAPALQPQDVDRLYPWRQKDLLLELNNRLGRRLLTTYDVQAVRRHHGLDEHPDFVFHLPGAGRRYSPAVADWILEQYARDPEFFHEARAADQAMLKLRRKKPR